MRPVRIRNNRGKAILFGVIGLTSALSYYFLFGIDHLLDLFFVIMGLVLVVYSVRGLMDRRPQLVLDGRGISGVRTRPDLIRWSEVRSVKREHFGGFEYLQVEFGPPEGPVAGTTRIRADNLDLPVLAIEKIIQHKAGLADRREEAGA